MGPRSSYHHGDLRAALIESSLALVGEQGVAGLSVGELARRVGVSSAAPYRHFANRAELLSATAAAAGRALHTELLESMAEVPRVRRGRSAVAVAVDELAAAARGYVGFALRTGTGFDLVMADEVRDVEDEDRATVTADLVALLLWPAVTVTGDPASAERLVRRFTAVVHGCSTFPRSGFARGHDVTIPFLAGEAADVVRLVASSMRGR